MFLLLKDSHLRMRGALFLLLTGPHLRMWSALFLLLPHPEAPIRRIGLEGWRRALLIRIKPNQLQTI